VRINIAVPEEHITPEILDAALEVGTRLNEKLVRDGVIPPFDKALAAGAVKWQPEPPGDEHFDHGGIVLKRGHGDCDDLGPYAAGSMRATGADPGAQSVVYKSGPKRWHAVVSTSEGELRDPSLEAGMRKRVGILPAAIAPMFPANQNAVVGDDGSVRMRPGVALKEHPRGGWVGRVDIPFDDTDYALTALHHAPVAAQAIVGSILGGIMAADCSGIANPDDLGKLRAICGVIGGENRDRLCALCGDEAVEGAIEFLGQIGAQLVKPRVSADAARRLAGTGHLPAEQVHAAAQAFAQHPAAGADERKLAGIIARHAAGERPKEGGLTDAVLRYMHNVFGPVVPDTAAEHARLLLADQAAKKLLQDPTFRLAAGADVYGHPSVVGGFFDDIGNAIGGAAKAVGGVIRDVAPVVAPIAAAMPPPMGPAIGGALALAGGIAGKLVPKGGGAPPPAQAAAPYVPPAYRPPPPAAPPAARPVVIPLAAPATYAAAQPGTPPPPVHVHMAAAPRGAAASAPVHVSAQPGGPVTIRF
jgi:hypothetical protein